MLLLSGAAIVSVGVLGVKYKVINWLTGLPCACLLIMFEFGFVFVVKQGPSMITVYLAF